jgi:hypothetical protein
MGRGFKFKSPFVHRDFIAFLIYLLSPTSVGFMARAIADICHGRRARQKPPSSLTLPPPGGLVLNGSGDLFVSTYDHVGEFTTSGGIVNASLISNG